MWIFRWIVGFWCVRGVWPAVSSAITSPAFLVSLRGGLGKEFFARFAHSMELGCRDWGAIWGDG